MDNIHLVSYGNHNYQRSKKRLHAQAVDFGIKNIYIYGPETLPAYFLSENQRYLDVRRGGGYWIWKPCVVKEALGKINYGEFLIYLDAGCSFNLKAKNRFNEYIEMASQHDILTFSMLHLEKTWTKQSLAKYLDCQNDEIMNSGQILSGAFILKKTVKNEELINAWYDICKLKWTVDDSRSKIPNHPEFREHRHDQSVFSLLVKKSNGFSISDETYREDFGDHIASGWPIHATRLSDIRYR